MSIAIYSKWSPVSKLMRMASGDMISAPVLSDRGGGLYSQRSFDFQGLVRFAVTGWSC